MNILFEKINMLRERIRKLDDALVAFSGGVDSSLVLKICYDELKNKTIAVTAVSPSVSNFELENAKSIAEWVGVKHIIVKSSETDDANYLKNDSQRCYFCKSNLYKKLLEVREQFNFRNIVNGINHDDIYDYRPGIKAAQEYQVVSPLKDVNLGKKDIVEIANFLGLPNWNKPASPCLSSRVPYGIAITPDILEKIEKAENVLRQLGFNQFRVRYYKETAQIEVEKYEFAKVIENASIISQQIKSVGFRYVVLDLAGFKSGNLNTGILDEQKILQRPRV